MAANMRTYERRAGTSADHGHKFELDLTILTYLRCLKLFGQGKLKYFWIANNMNHVGAFDDVVCHIEYEENGSLKTKIIFVQAKHKEDANTQDLSVKTLASTKEKLLESTGKKSKKPRVHHASLIKYIKSYLQTRQIFNESEDWEKLKDKIEATENAFENMKGRENLRCHFKCKLEDSLFLYYTNAAIFGLSNSVPTEMPDIVTQIFDTSSNTGIHQMKLNGNEKVSHIMSRIYGNLEEDEIIRVNQFEDNFKIYLNQEKDCNLEEVIKNEIFYLINDNNIDSVKMQSIYTSLCYEIKRYFQLVQSPFLREDINLISKINALFNLKIQTQEILNKYCTWSEIFRYEFIKNLYNIVTDRKFLKLPSNSITRTTTLVKCIQMAVKMKEKVDYKCLLFLYIKNNKSFEMWKQVRKLHSYIEYSEVLICVDIEVQSEEAYKVWSLDGGDRERIISMYEEDSVSESSFLMEVSPEGLKKIMSYDKITFQSVSVQLKDIFGNTVCPKILHSVLHHVLSNECLDFGRCLPEEEKIYIDRKYEKRETKCVFRNQSVPINEEEFLQQIIGSKCTVISNDVGMGKSTAMKRLTHCIKSGYKDKWVQYINLNMLDKKLKNLVEYTNLFAVLLHLLNLDDAGEMIFQHKFSTTGKVALLFDGFDEISCESRKNFSRLLTVLIETKTNTIVVSTRSNVETELKNMLLPFHYKLIGFNYNDMYSYLLKFWTRSIDKKSSEKLPTIVQDIVNQAKRMKEILRDVVAVPLQTKMLAETFNEKIISVLSSKEDLPSFELQKLSLYSLYNNFINMHIDRCMKEKFNTTDDNTSNYEFSKETYFKRETGIWEYIACKEIFPSIDLCDVTTSDIADLAKQRIGIFVQTDPEKISFIHRSFAEFLAAKHVTRLLFESKNIKRLNFIYQKILIDNTFFVFRKFMNAIYDNERFWETADINVVHGLEVADNVTFVVAVKENNAFIFRVILRHLSQNENMLKRILNQENNVGENLLHLSARFCEHVFDDILNSECFYCAKYYDKNGHTALHLACEYGRENAVKSYLNKNMYKSPFEIINHNDLFSLSPLKLALINGHTKVIKILHDHGEPIHNKDADGFNDLMCAVMLSRSIETIKFFVEQGVHINERNNDGETALMFACRGINDYNDGVACVRYLVEQAGADVNIQDCRGRSAAMHLIMKHDNIDILKCLIRNGADIKAVNSKGRNAAMLAAEYGRIETMKYIVDIGVEVVNEVDASGDTCFTLCSGADNTSLLRYFIEEHKPNLDYQNNEGETALFRALSKECFHNVKLLITHGASVNICNKKGDTALSAALDIFVGYKYVPNELDGLIFYHVVNYLVEKGAKINHQNNLKNSMLHLILKLVPDKKDEVKFNKLIKLLVELGADINLKNKEGVTPAMMAQNHEDPNVKSYFLTLINSKAMSS